MKTKDEIKGLRQSFQFAICGVLFCLNNERNMRIHFSTTVFIFVFALYYQLSRMEFAILFIQIGIVILAEMFNTSIEAVVNLLSPSYHTLAKIAKDVAAGAVSVAAISAVIVGFFLFGNTAKLLAAWIRITQSPWSVLSFVLIIILSLLFVFKGSGLISKISK